MGIPSLRGLVPATVLCAFVALTTQAAIVTEVEPEHGLVDLDQELTVRGGDFEGGSTVGMPRSRWPRLTASIVPPGDVWGVDALGGSAFAAGEFQDPPAGSGLRIFDFPDPGPAVLVGAVTIPGNARAVEVVGDLAYVAAGTGGLRIVDVGDRADPRPLGAAPAPSFAWSVAVAGDVAYVAANSGDGGWNGRVWTIDVRDPGAPLPVGSVSTPGSAWTVRVDGDRLYIADGDEGVAIFDITDPWTPLPLGTVPTPGSAWGLDFAEGYLFVTGVARSGPANGWILVADVDEPADPRVLGTTQTPGEAWSVEVRKGMAYVADFDAGIHAFDVTDPARPVSAGRCDALGFAAMIAIEGDDAFLASMSNGVHRYDLTAPSASPVASVLDTPGSSRDLRPFGSLITLADGYGGLRVLDPTDPDAIHECGFCGIEGGIWRVSVDGTTAVGLAGGFGGVDLARVRLDDPFAPFVDGRAPLPGLAYDVAAANGQAHVVGIASVPRAHGFIWSFDLAATVPDLIAVRVLDAHADTIVLDGRVAFVGGHDGSDPDSGVLWILDTEAPASEPPTAALALLGRPRAIALTDEFAFVGADLRSTPAMSRLWIVDRTDPGQPFVRSEFPIPGHIHDVAVFDDQVHVVGTGCPNGRKGMLRTVDVRDPDRPVLSGRYDLPGEAFAVHAEPGRVLVADGMTGIQQVRVHPPVENVSVTGPASISVRAPAGFGPGAYDVRVVGSESRAEGIALYRACLDREFGADLVPAIDPVPVTPATPFGTRVPWRVVAHGDSLFFGREPRHLAGLVVPDAVATLPVRFMPGPDDETIVEATWSPELEIGEVRIRGPVEAEAQAMWDRILAQGEIPLPRLDGTSHGDVELSVHRARRGFPYRSGVTRSVVRYVLSDGALISAAASGRGADLEVRAVAEDQYACTYEETWSYLDALREACLDFVARHPAWVLDCEFSTTGTDPTRGVRPRRSGGFAR